MDTILHEPWHDDPLADEIYKTLRQREFNILMYFHQSPQKGHRRYLVDWLAGICDAYELCNTARHLTITLLDFFMDNFDVEDLQLKLVSLGCLLVAAKFEERETNIPKAKDLNKKYVTAPGYELWQYLHMELTLLDFFKWKISIPTAAHFTDYIHAVSVVKGDVFNGEAIMDLDYAKDKVSKYCNYFLEISLQDEIYRDYKPSLVCAACFAASRMCMRISPHWSAALCEISSYSWQDVAPVIHHMLKTYQEDEQLTRKEDAVSTNVAASPMSIPSTPSTPASLINQSDTAISNPNRQSQPSVTNINQPESMNICSVENFQNKPDILYTSDDSNGANSLVREDCQLSSYNMVAPSTVSSQTTLSPDGQICDRQEPFSEHSNWASDTPESLTIVPPLPCNSMSSTYSVSSAYSSHNLSELSNSNLNQSELSNSNLNQSEYSVSSGSQSETTYVPETPDASHCSVNCDIISGIKLHGSGDVTHDSTQDSVVLESVVMAPDQRNKVTSEDVNMFTSVSNSPSSVTQMDINNNYVCASGDAPCAQTYVTTANNCVTAADYTIVTQPVPMCYANRYQLMPPQQDTAQPMKQTCVSNPTAYIVPTTQVFTAPNGAIIPGSNTIVPQTNMASATQYASYPQSLPQDGVVEEQQFVVTSTGGACYNCPSYIPTVVLLPVTTYTTNGPIGGQLVQTTSTF